MVPWTLRFTFVLSCNSTKMTEKGQTGMNSDRKKKPQKSMRWETTIATLYVLSGRIEIYSLELGVSSWRTMRLNENVCIEWKAFSSLPSSTRGDCSQTGFYFPDRRLEHLEEIWQLKILCLLDFSKRHCLVSPYAFYPIWRIYWVI